MVACLSGLVGFTLIMEILIFYMEEDENLMAYKEVKDKLFQALLILGLISFILFITEQVGSSSYYS